ncbi:MAG TPA: DUF302 domain-containing protein [Ignavibacteria bacterium]|nr:DUF302 domain-containing protein [Ignavibacteria bacterium]HQY51652.1 DUF302 domain-containing protein [Ignavibacteria bacterium]HRA99124.1 DUF302 domain-containing protein [Ignavibacteria bacterium]
MSYSFDKTLTDISFDDAITKVTDELKKEGFGILTEIDVKETLKKKIDADINNYKILGACNPGFAHKAILAENKIGVFLPCNVIVMESENGDIEISAVDPSASMSAVNNESLAGIAVEVRDKLKKVIDQV